MTMHAIRNFHPTSAWAAILVALGFSLGFVPGARAAHHENPRWLGETMPLPLSVRTPRDLEFKSAAERQYLIFNLLAGGKWAWDQGQFADAADRWEALLEIPRLDGDLAKLVRPLAKEARDKAGSAPRTPAREPVPAAPPEVDPPGLPVAKPVVRTVVVSGVVEGGGARGPGGAVIWLKRLDGSTPKPRPRQASMRQANKAFVPRVLTVPVGSTVTFDNEDPIFHNVFSLSKPNDFDSGLFKGGSAYRKIFNAPGAAQVLCNIHASMLGYIVVVDSPWFAQVDREGRFTIKDVQPGRYQALAWHESSSQVSKHELQVGDGGVRDLRLSVKGDRSPEAFVPDKYGKPRQRQLGY